MLLFKKAPKTTSRSPSTRKNNHQLSSAHLSRQAGSTFITKINIKVIPRKITTVLLVIYNVISIMTAVSAADNFARIIAINHKGKEIKIFGLQRERRFARF